MTESADAGNSMATMKALVFHGPHTVALEDRPRPTILQATDAIVRITTTTLCGTDLHILKGDVPTIAAGRILGHEGVGIIETVGEAVVCFHKGDRVLVSLVTSCGRCSFCKKGMFSHCRTGGWVLGNSIDGTQAEYVRVPFADTGLHLLPPDVDDEAAVMLSCTLPTGLECGVLNGQVKPGDIVAIVGAGPVGLAALLTAQLYSPAETIMIDLDDNRLAVARSFGATKVVNSSDGKAAERVMALTKAAGVDVAIEAVGLSATFDICQAIIAPGGRIANVGVHGSPVELHLERLWASNITLTTRLVDAGTTSMLLNMVHSGRLAAGKFVSHRFRLSEILEAYDTFENAAKQHAIKVVITNTCATDWSAVTLTRLADHILETHHVFMKEQLPRLDALLGKVQKAHGARHGDMLQSVRSVFDSLRLEFDPHLAKEEQTLFPAIKSIDAFMSATGPRPAVHRGSLAQAIPQMECEHVDFGHRLGELRRLTGGYDLPADACPSFAALYDGLKAMEADLHEHIHLENDILFREGLKREASVIGKGS